MPMITQNFNEQRLGIRVFVGMPLLYRLPENLDPQGSQRKGLIQNISTEGIYFRLEDIIPIRTELKISFELPDKRRINASVRVMRIEFQEKENKYGIGAYFTEIRDEDLGEICRQLVEKLDINNLLRLTIEKKASDLHLIADRQPVMRINGEIVSLKHLQPLSAEDIPRLLFSIMSQEQIKRFQTEKELDFAVQFDEEHRFRVNVHQQRGNIEAALRLIHTRIFSFEELTIPAVVKDLARLKDGLVLIVGTTGSGKSTTMAAMVDLINKERKGVVITLERPIEYVYVNDKCIIKQREVGIDTNSFSAALKSTLRQDPNVIIVGELDDAETIKTALIAAEAGHLVIASFHAPNTIQAIDRLTSMFPVAHRKQVLFQMANALRGIVCQILLPCSNKDKRVLATEVMIANDAVKHIIRNNELLQLATLIQTGASQGMIPMKEAIWKAFEMGQIDGETANAYAEEFKVPGR